MTYVRGGGSATSKAAGTPAAPSSVPSAGAGAIWGGSTSAVTYCGPTWPHVQPVHRHDGCVRSDSLTLSRVAHPQEPQRRGFGADGGLDPVPTLSSSAALGVRPTGDRSQPRSPRACVRAQSTECGEPSVAAEVLATTVCPGAPCQTRLLQTTQPRTLSSGSETAANTDISMRRLRGAKPAVVATGQLFLRGDGDQASAHASSCGRRLRSCRRLPATLRGNLCGNSSSGGLELLPSSLQGCLSFPSAGGLPRIPSGPLGCGSQQIS